MSRRPPRAIAPILIAVAAMAIAGCTQGTGAPTNPDHGSGSGSEFSFGSPAPAADADRVIEITTTDNLAFEPADITVKIGETITFRLINQGNLIHDFTLGDQAAQDHHEAEMAAMAGMSHGDPNVVVVPAGETVELTWTFTEPGTILIGCHQPGHYAAGMTGRVTVEG